MDTVKIFDDFFTLLAQEINDSIIEINGINLKLNISNHSSNPSIQNGYTSLIYDTYLYTDNFNEKI